MGQPYSAAKNIFLGHLCKLELKELVAEQNPDCDKEEIECVNLYKFAHNPTTNCKCRHSYQNKETMSTPSSHLLDICLFVVRFCVHVIYIYTYGTTQD